MMSHNSFNGELLEIMEQQRPCPKLEKVAFKQIKHNLFEAILLHWFKKCGSVTTCTMGEDDAD